MAMSMVKEGRIYKEEIKQKIEMNPIKDSRATITENKVLESLGIRSWMIIMGEGLRME
jgi:hypothetical protein